MVSMAISLSTYLTGHYPVLANCPDKHFGPHSCVDLAVLAGDIGLIWNHSTHLRHVPIHHDFCRYHGAVDPQNIFHASIANPLLPWKIGAQGAQITAPCLEEKVGSSRDLRELSENSH